MKAFSESQRVLELERKLFSTERALKLCQSTNIKLQVKLDELRLQYEPNGNPSILCTHLLLNQVQK